MCPFGYLNLETRTRRDPPTGRIDPSRGPHVRRAKWPPRGGRRSSVFPRFVGLAPTGSVEYPSAELGYTQVLSKHPRGPRIRICVDAANDLCGDIFRLRVSPVRPEARGGCSRGLGCAGRWRRRQRCNVCRKPGSMARIRVVRAQFRPVSAANCACHYSDAERRGPNGFSLFPRRHARPAVRVTGE